MNLDILIYDSERLACTDEEKDACLETVKKLARLCPQMRREGMLIVLTLAESEPDPFYRNCLLEFGECPASAETLEQIFCAYLAAENYRGGAFLNAVLSIKGLLLMYRTLEQSPRTWGDLLSNEIRGFFGVAYRDKVIQAIKHELHTKRDTSFVPEFDRLSQLSLNQRQVLVRKVDLRVLTIALSAASAVAEDTLLGALTEDMRKKVEEKLPYMTNLRETDVTQAQEELIKQWEAMKPSLQT